MSTNDIDNTEDFGSGGEIVERKIPEASEIPEIDAEVWHQPNLIAHRRFAEGNKTDDIWQRELLSVGEWPPDYAEFDSSSISFIPEGKKRSGDLSEDPKEIQDWCKRDDTAGGVIYQIRGETDEFEEGSGEQAKAFVVRFLEGCLEIDEAAYELSYSGGTSVHFATDRFVVGEKGRAWLKEVASEFCNKTGASLDLKVFSKDRVLRMLGATHGRTGRKKVKISADTQREEAVEKAENCYKSVRMGYDIGRGHPVIEHAWPILNGKELDEEVAQYLKGPLPKSEDQQSNAAGGETAGRVESATADESSYHVPLESHFCLHTGARGGDQTDGPSRSVCVARQHPRVDDVIEEGGDYFVRVLIYHGIGANGDFTRDEYDGWMRVSKRDLPWEFSSGDQFVAIGGRSWKARVLDLTGQDELVEQIAHRLRSEGRGAALMELEYRGFDVGGSGYNGVRPPDADAQSNNSEAAILKQRIENGKLEPERDDIIKAACRVLELRGWDAAWNWCEQVFDDDFDPEITYEELKSLVEQYDDFDVEVPNRQRVLGK